MAPPVEKTCPRCGKIFRVRASKAHKYTHCSMDCRKSPAEQLTLHCLTCGAPFVVNRARLDIAKFCSYDCHYAQHRSTIICAYCGKPKVKKRHLVVEGARCCSNRCATLLRMQEGWDPGWIGVKVRSGYRTDIEALVEQVLIRLAVPHIFEKKVGRWHVDFLLTEDNIALECDGWQHLTAQGRARDSMRDAALHELGLTVVHLPDKAIRANPEEAVRNGLNLKE